MRAVRWALLALPVVAAGFNLRRQDNGTDVHSSSSSASTSTHSSSSSIVSSSTTHSSSTHTVSSTHTTHSTTSTSESSSSTTSTSIAPSSTTLSSLSTSSPSSSSATSSTSAFIAPLTTTTTPGVSPDIVTTADNSDTTSDDSSPTNDAASNVGASSKGFWSNKGAVAGTFTVVGLVALGILFLFLRTMKRRQESRNSARDTFFDTKTPVAVERPPSFNASMVSLGNDAMDPHATPTPNYGGADQYLVDTNEYNYPPGSAYNAQQYPVQQYYDTTPQQEHYPQQQFYGGPTAISADHVVDSSFEAYNQYYGGQADMYLPPERSATVSPHPYADPNASPRRPFVGRDIRDSAGVQSLDSFYGASGTAL